MSDETTEVQEGNINYSQLLLQAVESHFVAKKSKALANLNNNYEDARILICGSLYLAGKVLEMN